MGAALHLYVPLKQTCRRYADHGPERNKVAKNGSGIVQIGSGAHGNNNPADLKI